MKKILPRAFLIIPFLILHANSLAAGIYVVGKGAVGLSTAARAAKSLDKDVKIITRDASQDGQRIKLKVQADGGIFYERTTEIIHWSRISKFLPGDIVILATDSNNLDAVIAQLSSRLDANIVVLWGQNGLIWNKLSGTSVLKTGEHIRFMYNFGMEAAVTEDGSSYQIRHVAEPSVTIANGTAAPSTIDIICGLLKQTGVKYELAKSWQEAEFAKIAINATTNGPNTIFGGTLGDLLSYEERKYLIVEILKEIKEIGLAAAYSLPEGFEDRILNLINKNGHHVASMRRHYLAGLPMEIDAIYGELTKMAASLGISVKALAAVRDALVAVRPSPNAQDFLPCEVEGVLERALNGSLVAQ